MIRLRPFSDLDAQAVFNQLDFHDWMEAELVIGRPPTSGGLFADWRAVEGARLLSYIVVAERAGASLPFAVLGVSHTGQAGVAAAALLARRHDRFRRELAELAVRVRREMPVFCDELGVHRIEARSWDGHPTASALLDRLGFVREATMPGFGQFGTEIFHQWAYIAPHVARLRGEAECVQHRE